MRVKTRITKANAIIAIELPLVQAWNYQLYEVLSVPLFINNTQIKIHPSTQYLLVDHYRERFAPVTITERMKCKDILDDLVLCEIPTLYTRESQPTQCEISMFANLPVQHESCHMSMAPPQNYFIKLHAPNQWIFGVNQTLTVDLICNSTIYPKGTLAQYGILKLTSGCTLRSNDRQLSAVSTKITSIDGSFIPAFNISAYHIDSSSRAIHHLNFSPTTPNTTQLENDINLLQRDESTSLTSHHLHHYIVSHLILWPLICIGILWLIRAICRKRRQATWDNAQPQQPIPQPRSRNRPGPQYVQSRV